MEIRIEGLAFGFDFLQALLREHVEHLLANQLESLAKFVVCGVAMCGNGAVEAVENGKQIFDEDFGAAMAVMMALAVDALPIVVEIGLKAKQSVLQISFFSGEFLEFVADYFFHGGTVRGVLSLRFARDVLGSGRFRIP